MNGPRAFLSGAKGFYKTFLQRDAGHEAARWFQTEDLQIERIWLKPYCCCGCIHAYIDALQAYAGRGAEVAKLNVRIQPSANVIVGTANANAWQPRNIEHVQFSLPVQLALTLLGKGNGYAVHHGYLAGRLDMEAVMAVAARVEIEVVPELDQRYPGRFVADVTVTLNDGRSERVFVDDPLGTAENPLSESAQDAKFRELTNATLGTQRADALLAALRRLDGNSRPTDLTALCVPHTRK